MFTMHYKNHIHSSLFFEKRRIFKEKSRERLGRDDEQKEVGQKAIDFSKAARKSETTIGRSMNVLKGLQGYERYAEEVDNIQLQAEDLSQELQQESKIQNTAEKLAAEGNVGEAVKKNDEKKGEN